MGLGILPATGKEFHVPCIESEDRFARANPMSRRPI
jgi:hypothetical protein